MATSNRAALINKTIKVVKKYYKPVPASTNRTLFENLLYACCLENSLCESADHVFEVLTRDYFDWNEVRVSTIRELADVMKPLNDPEASATRMKRVLQSVFETHYSFDLEALKKQNIGQAAKGLGNYHGATSFLVSYVTQNSLGGHSIPVNQGLLESMRIIGVISDTEAAKGTVPGLERTIPKNKGIDAGMLLHQLGIELHRSPYGPTIRKILLEITPECKDRLPKRPVKKPKQQIEKPTQPITKKGKLTKSQPAKTQTLETRAKSKKPNTTKEAKSQIQKKSPAKKKNTTTKSATRAASVPEKNRTAKKKAAKKKTGLKKAVKKKVAKKGKAFPATKEKKKATNKRLAKRKPR
jgi:endonuclease-3